MDILNNVIDQEQSITGTEYETLGSVLSVVLNYMLGSGIAISIIFMIIAGIKYMESKGDPRAVDTAKNSLTYSLIAFILCAGALTVKTLIFNTIGVSNTDVQNSVPTF